MTETTNNNNKVYWVKGNTQPLIIPLEQEVMTEHDEIVATPYYPDGNAEVVVTFVGKWMKYNYTPIVDGNLLKITSDATLPAGCYGVEVVVKNQDGTQYRSLWDNQVVVTNSNPSVLQEWDEFKNQEVQARAALFFFAKGDKGDAFTYADFTQEQIEELQKPAVDAAAELTTEVRALESEFTESENQRVANENQRIDNEIERVNSETSREQQSASDHTTALEDHTTSVGDHTTAQSDHTTALSDHTQALSDHITANGDHTRAESDHALAATDHTTATSDHETAVQDNTQMTELMERAVADHVQAATDHTIAESDHTTATSDHVQAATDHTTAVSDHTQAVSDHSTAAADHTTAESDHAAVEVYVDSLGAFDISAYHAVGGVLAKYADLAAALGTNGANIPEGIRKGGMSVKFIQSSDNKYIQARCMAQNFTTDVTQWQGVDDEPTADSQNLVKSGGVFAKIQDIKDEVLGDDIVLRQVVRRAVLPKVIPAGVSFFINTTGDGSFWAASNASQANLTRLSTTEANVLSFDFSHLFRFSGTEPTDVTIPDTSSMQYRLTEVEESLSELSEESKDIIEGVEENNIDFTSLQMVNNSNMLFNKSEILAGKTIGQDGNIYNSPNSFLSNEIPYSKGDKIYFYLSKEQTSSTPASQKMDNIVFYDENHEFVKGKANIKISPLDTGLYDDIPQSGFVRIKNANSNIDDTYITKVGDTKLTPSNIAENYLLKEDGVVVSNNLWIDRYAMDGDIETLWQDPNSGNYLDRNGERRYKSVTQIDYIEKCNDAFLKSKGIVRWFNFPANEGPVNSTTNQVQKRIGFIDTPKKVMKINYAVSCIIKTSVSAEKLKEDIQTSQNIKNTTITKIAEGYYVLKGSYWYYSSGYYQGDTFYIEFTDTTYDVCVCGWCMEDMNNNYGLSSVIEPVSDNLLYRQLSLFKEQIYTYIDSKFEDLLARESYWKGKKIAVAGMSICSAYVGKGKYRGMTQMETAAAMLGATCYNQAFSGHFVHRGGLVSDGVHYAWGLACDLNEETTWDGEPSTTRSYQHQLLGMNRDGSTIFDYNDIDLFVIDMGVNDFANDPVDPDSEYLKVDMTDPYNRDSTTHPYTGGMNYIIREIYRAKPTAQIALINHFEKSQRNAAYYANNAVAKFWNIPIFNDVDFNGINMNDVFATGEPDLLYLYAGNGRLHPYNFDNLFLKRRVYALVNWLKSFA